MELKKIDSRIFRRARILPICLTWRVVCESLGQVGPEGGGVERENTTLEEGKI